MSWPYTSCGNVQVNRGVVFAALLLVVDPHHPHSCCYSKKPLQLLTKMIQHLYVQNHCGSAPVL